jgi:hypothetical protein
VVHALPGEGRHFAALGVAAPVARGLQAERRQLALHLVGVGLRLVDLVEGDHDLDAGRLRVGDASSVWGITPSAASTTITATSVALAPRERIWVKASWPGVSRKTTDLPSLVAIFDAPMCWVMPPDSPLATFGVADLVQQRRLAVVDVAHEGDDRARVDEILGVVLHARVGLHLLFGRLLLDDVMSRLNSAARMPTMSSSRAGVLVHHHGALVHQLLDDLGHLDAGLLAEVLIVIGTVISILRSDIGVMTGRGFEG